jgi:hypothetical protein
MENCKHERCEWVAEKKHWYFRIPAAFGTSINGVTHCPDCGAKLTPHEPPVMTLEEVQADMMKWARVFGRDKLDRDKGILDTWHRSITAHLAEDQKRDDEYQSLSGCLYDVRKERDGLQKLYNQASESLSNCLARIVELERQAAHLEKEPQGLTGSEIRNIVMAANVLAGIGPDLTIRDISNKLRSLAQRHTKGEKHDDPSGWRSKP